MTHSNCHFDLSHIKDKNRMYIPECTNPLILINRAAINLLSQGFQLYINGNPSNLINKVNYVTFPFNRLLLNIDKYDLEQSFVRRNNYNEPLFMAVPCGHCDLCRHRKKVDFVARCNMESQLYDTPPYFFTLTYDDAHLPSNGDLQYKDVQDMFKRLRRHWDYKHIPHKIRFVCACEYGSKTSRPHYHLIIWNNPYGASELIPKLHHQFGDDVFRAWGKCKPQGFDFSQCSGGAAGYVAKYISKPANMRGHIIRPSIKSSIAGGGIGFPLIKSKQHYYHNNPHLRVFSYIDSTTGNPVNVNFGSYVTQHLFPSPSRLVPVRLKNSFREYTRTLMALVSMHALTFDIALEWSNNVKPSYINNNITIPKTSHHQAGLCKLYYLNQYQKVLNKLVDLDLSEKFELPAEYIEKYYLFKSLSKEQERDDFAGKLLRLRQKCCVEHDKETF